MMNETGSYPGQAWLWLYTFWYQISPFKTSGNADALVWALMMILSLGLILVPIIPGAALHTTMDTDLQDHLARLLPGPPSEQHRPGRTTRLGARTRQVRALTAVTAHRAHLYTGVW